jgi:hypothetical protein
MYLLDIEYANLMKYYCRTAKANPVNECNDGLAGKPGDSAAISYRLGNVDQTVLKFTVQMH